MRILAIRGRNLASLAGDFAIELERPPIGNAGLFLIHGPVGAGTPAARRRFPGTTMRKGEVTNGQPDGR